MIFHRNLTTDVPQITLNHCKQLIVQRVNIANFSVKRRKLKPIEVFRISATSSEINQLHFASRQQALQVNLRFNKSHELLQFSFSTFHSNLDKNFSNGNLVIQMEHYLGIELYTYPATCVQPCQKSFSESFTNTQNQGNLYLKVQVVVTHGTTETKQTIY